jgi:hypothetical protein
MTSYYVKFMLVRGKSMVSDLERGIIAARKGRKAEAKKLLIRVLKQNNRNEQAWLWLSEAVDTIGEQIACIEQVLRIDPDNTTAKYALKKLKSQPSQRSAGSQPAIGSPSAVEPSLHEQSRRERKPFRLSEMPPHGPQSEAVYHEATMSLPPTSMPAKPKNQHTLLRRAEATPRNLPKTNGTSNRSRPATLKDPNDIPLLPLILFGTLSVTAIGGMLMMLLLVFLG